MLAQGISRSRSPAGEGIVVEKNHPTSAIAYDIAIVIAGEGVVVNLDCPTAAPPRALGAVAVDVKAVNLVVPYYEPRTAIGIRKTRYRMGG